MTSLLREEVMVPMALAASATMTSCPLSASARAHASPTTPAPTTSTCMELLNVMTRRRCCAAIPLSALTGTSVPEVTSDHNQIDLGVYLSPWRNTQSRLTSQSRLVFGD